MGVDLRGAVRATADHYAGKPQPRVRRPADAEWAVPGEASFMKRILIASDGSPEAQEAVEYGLELARSSHASATVVYVRRAPRPLMGDPFYQRDLTDGIHRAGDAL